MISLGAIKNSRAVQVAASCKDSEEFISLVNDACRRLLRRGDWPCSVQPIFVCVYNGCIVWPRYVDQVRKLNVCNQSIPVTNEWYQFLPQNTQPNAWLQYAGQETGLNAQGISPVFQDIQGDGRLVRAYARQRVDLGKTFTIYGIDNNNQPLITRNADTGEITQGITLTLAAPFASTSTYVRRIDYIIRDQTQDIVDVYAYNVASDVLEEVGHYEPTDTEPKFLRNRLLVPWSYPQSTVVPGTCSARMGVVALVKLRHIDAQVNSDLLVMDNLDAIKQEILSIKAEEQGDYKSAQIWEGRAIEILNRDLENTSPDYQFSAANNTLGPWIRNNHCR